MQSTPPTPESWLPRRRKWSRLLEKIALGIEKPTNRLIGNYHLNPFYHTGVIALFLFIVVGLTGIYLYLFFQYGFEASYNAVQTRIEAPILARTVRAVHRYASDALVVTVLLHAFRTLFMENFRGPRRLAWLTGIFMTFILWLAGITGYWLIWDTRSQVINDHFVDFLQQVTPFADDYVFALTRARVTGNSWQLVFIGFLVHLGLFLIVAIFFWLHTRHLKRIRLFPPAVWMAGAGGVLVVIALLFPAGMLPIADAALLPSTVRLDPIYLYYLPVESWGWAGLLWAFMWAVTALVVALPWTKWRGRSAESTQPLVKVLNDKCTGCAKCANDCPYGALTMVERNDENSKFDMLAVADPSRCVGCGICVGSCDEFLAITLGDVAPDSTWE
ncbi:MAG TPA: 4Fe-4S dicluster domain-containing protein, partial [Anaerolineae bacterium]|nr:4Fe-4S dicluster domain-containing protein [Anaerolineae bacterium]